MYVIVKTAVVKFQKTNKEIFLQSGLDIRYVDKTDNVEEKFGTVIANTRVKRIDEHEAPGSVTIYL